MIADELAARAALLPPLPDSSVSAPVVAPGFAPPPSVVEPPIRSPEEAAAALRSAVEHAVERALAGATAVAVMTGGGLDSSTLLAIAVRCARTLGLRVFGIALDFGGPGDDRPHRAALERHVGCEIVRVAPEEAAARIEHALVGVSGAPFTWPGGPMEVELLARARALGADRALMGIGADHLFDGDPRSLAELALGLRPRSAVLRARRLEGFARPRFPAASWVARPIVASLVPTWIRRRRGRRTKPHVPRWAGPRLERVAARIHALEVGRALPPPRTVRQRYVQFASAPHLEHLLALRDQEIAASGTERIDPFLDPDVIATAMRIEPHLLLTGDVRRGLFRKAFADLLPASVRDRSDKAAFEPAFARFASAAGGLASLRSLSDVRELSSRAIADPRRFREAFESFVANPEDPDGWSEVWPALTVESFLRHHGAEAGATT